MAIDSAYATAANYRKAIKKSDPGDDPRILIDLGIVSRFLDVRLRRLAGFAQDTSAVARIFEVGARGHVGPGGQRILDVDDLVSITSIKVDQSIVGNFTDSSVVTAASTDYELLPRNATLGPTSKPYDAIRWTPWGDIGPLQQGARVEITAKYGWPSVPGPIERACIELTGILRLETPRATVTVPEDMNGVVQQSPVAQQIIWNLATSFEKPVY